MIRTAIGVNVDVLAYADISKTNTLQYRQIILSPGPGLPVDYPSTMSLLSKSPVYTSFLGICLGHQMIYEASGGLLEKLEKPLHGFQERMFTCENYPLFQQIPHSFLAGRYHSWLASKTSFPSELKVTCSNKAGQIMGIRHLKKNWVGYQFHPESIMTPDGKQLLFNWMALDAFSMQ